MRNTARLAYSPSTGRWGAATVHGDLILALLRQRGVARLLFRMVFR